MISFYFIFVFHVSSILCGEIKNLIYYELPDYSVSHCVRRLNRSSAIGCTSDYNGNVGTIEVAFNESNLRDTINRLSDNSIFVLTSDLFIQTNVTEQLLLNKFIKGVIIVENTFCNDIFCTKELEKSFSEDYKRPNSQYSFSLNSTFNPSGSAYGFRDWPFPIVYIKQLFTSEQNKIIACYNKFNKNPTSKKRCAIEIKNFMAAVQSAETAMKYQEIQNRFAGQFHNFYFFNYFTGTNYYVHTKEVVESRDSNSVLVLITRLDSLSMFERSAFSANGAITSTALLLSVMKHLLSQPEFKTGKDLKKDVVFLFLDNESYDYLGSNRFFHDLYKDNVANGSSTPMNATHLGLLLEFGELAYSNFSQVNLFSPISSMEDFDKNETYSYLKNLNEQFRKFGFQNNATIHDGNLPPSSLQFFLNQRKLPSIIISDHQGTFQNPFYNSFLDKNPKKNNSEELIAIVNSVSSFIFKETTGKDLEATVSDSDEYSPTKIIECFTENLLCDLLKQVLPTETLKKLAPLGTPIPTQEHSSTTNVTADYRFSKLLRNLIVYLSGQRMNNSVCESCAKCDNLSWITSGNDTKECFKTKIDSYEDFSFDNKGVPLWLTSSIVDKQSVTMFVRGPNTSLLIFGSVITLIWALIMTLVSSKYSVIFSAGGQ